MKQLWILYSASFDTKEENPATRMLDEALSQEIDAKLYFYHYFTFSEGVLYYQDKKVHEYPQVVFIRGHELSLIEHFESKGVRVINSSFTTKHCRDKYLTHQIVDTLHIPQPKTILLSSVTFNEAKEQFGIPFIVKYRHGSKGDNIYLIEDKKSFLDIISTVNTEDYLLQTYIKDSYGKDVRTYVIGNEVIGAVLRRSENHFMSNLAQGGLTYDYQLTDELKDMSLKITQALKGDIVSVDYLFSDQGLLFCEANTNAGFASFNFMGYPTRTLMMKYIKTMFIDDEITAYINQFNGEKREKLHLIRDTIKHIMPSAKEKISWGMPTFYDKHPIIHYAAQKHHLGIYPGPDAINHFKSHLIGYKVSKGAIQIPWNDVLPIKIIEDIAKWCYEQNL